MSRLDNDRYIPNLAKVDALLLSKLGAGVSMPRSILLMTMS
jgi:hypothetical protein